ncbi:hypothetical protein BOTNAR_0438g00100 [Botryotinia narcissicola]|uniref:Ubiquitin 3 binding protein But2 C-terminal domain-containing protein n=1 Tax=Botryotinia narcissicola TaxID=278944 RepID=A0A4Z1HPN8_9HELO|nr:hypothetical protein BOTNAR_0438g00100 [Botryotinia narcissicola]
MFVPVSKIKFLTILSILFVIVSGNPIKRSEDDATGVRISGIFGLFTTIATSALTTEWGVLEPTRSSSSSSTFAAGAIAVTSTFGNTPYSFATSGFPAASTQIDASASGDSLTDAPASASASASSSEDTSTDTPASATASASEDPSTETQASASASASTDSTQTLILTPTIEDKQRIAATTSSCDPAIAGVTIPANALTTGEYVAVEVLCEETIYIQEPNFYPTKTWYGMPTSWTLDNMEKISTSTSTSSICNTTIAGTTIPASALTTGEFVAVETLCGETIYIQEPNFYPTKTYYGISDAALGSMPTTSAMSASSSSTTMDFGWQILNARAEDGVLIFRE